MKALPVPLKLNGKAFDPKAAAAPAERIRALLDGAPADELFSQAELVRKLSIAQSLASGASAPLAAYTATAGRRRYWGNPRAIAELRRQLTL
ncbi:MAG: hypothetical protein WCA44_18060 [Acidobacteriaceae bacterium]